MTDLCAVAASLFVVQRPCSWSQNPPHCNNMLDEQTNSYHFVKTSSVLLHRFLFCHYCSSYYYCNLNDGSEALVDESNSPQSCLKKILVLEDWVDVAAKSNLGSHLTSTSNQDHAEMRVVRVK